MSPTVVCYNVLQCVAVHGSVLQCVAVHGSVLQCVAACCSQPVFNNKSDCSSVKISSATLSQAAGFPRQIIESLFCENSEKMTGS